MLGHAVPVKGDLVPEFLLAGIFEEACQGVIVRLVEKLDALTLPAGVEEVLEGLDDFALVEFRLIQKRPGQAHGELELGPFRDKRRQRPDGGKVALPRLIGEELPVSLIPQELVPLGMEQERVMELEIENDG